MCYQERNDRVSNREKTFTHRMNTIEKYTIPNSDQAI